MLRSVRFERERKMSGMKKLLSITLSSLLIVTMAVAFGGALAETPSGCKVAFEGISVSTVYAVAEYGLGTISALADPQKDYVAGEMIFGYVKFKYDESKPNPETDLSVKVHSDYVT